MQFEAPIGAVKMNPRRLVVAMQDKVEVLDLKTLQKLLTIEREDSPPDGLTSAAVCLAAHVDVGLLAVSVGSTGQVALWDCFPLAKVGGVSAHRTPVTCIAMAQDAETLVTAS